MNWDDLRYLLTAARERNLSAAGRKLGVNQTTISRRLQHLQDDLAVRLVDHTTRGISLTPAGEEVLRAATAVDEVLTSLDRSVVGGDARLRGSLRVTVSDLTTLDGELFASFTRAYPGIDLELAVSDRTLNITRREADVALRFASRPPEDLVARQLARVDYAAYASHELVEAVGKRAKLDRYPWLGWDESKGAKGTEAWMRANVPAARIACRFDSAVAMFAAARAGMGAALVPCGYAELEPQLRQVTPADPTLAWFLWVLVHPDLRKNARVRAFVEHVVEYHRVATPRFSPIGARSKRAHAQSGSRAGRRP
jgi:DNA-binding transcriptional LysR family regulator